MFVLIHIKAQSRLSAYSVFRERRLGCRQDAEVLDDLFDIRVG